MKKCVIFLMFCSFLLNCGQHQQEPEPPIEPEKPCGCCNVEPIEGYIWYRELSIWDYPSRWDYQNDDEWLDSAQIPTNVLSSLSTEDLVEICIQHPISLYFWCGVFLAYTEDVNVCMDNIVNSFNGLNELFKREDGVIELLIRYDEIVSNIAANCSENVCLSIYLDLEILLGRYQTNNDNAVEIYREILRHLVDGYHAKLLFPEIFSVMFSLTPNYVARANMITRIRPGSIPSKPDLPCIFGYQPDDIERNLIDELSYELIK